MADDSASEPKPPGSVTKKGGEAWFIEISRDYEKRRAALKDFAAKDGDGWVPKHLAESYRTAADRMRKTWRSHSGMSPGRDGSLRSAFTFDEDGRGDEEEAPPPADNVGDEELMAMMQSRWVEVECLLRVQLRTPDALSEARRRVLASLRFDEGVAAQAASSHQLKGTIFQALLAFADGRAESTAASVACGVGDAEWAELAMGADALRKLVRIKVQDDNDLKAANLALKSCAEFFDNLAVYARRHGLDETEVLPKLEFR